MKYFYFLFIILVSCGESKEKSSIGVRNSIELIPVKKDGKFVYIDFDGNQKFENSFLDASVFKDGAAIVKVENDGKQLYGFIGTDGKYILPPVYKQVTFFSEGIAWVVEPGSCPKAVDQTGKVLFKLEKANAVRAFYGGLAAFSYFDEDGKEYWAFVDKNGLTVLDEKFEKAEDFKKGVCMVMKYGKYGLIDKQGKPIINFSQDRMAVYENGDVLTWEPQLIMGDSRMQRIYNKASLRDSSSGFVKSTRFDHIRTDGNMYMVLVNNRIGWIEKDSLRSDVYNKEITYNYKIEPQFENANRFLDDDLALIKKNGKYGFIDRKGNPVIPAKLDFALSFMGDYCIVSIGNQFTFMNKKAEISKVRFDGVSQDLVNVLGSGDYYFSYREIKTDLALTSIGLAQGSADSAVVVMNNDIQSDGSNDWDVLEREDPTRSTIPEGIEAYAVYKLSGGNGYYIKTILVKEKDKFRIWLPSAEASVSGIDMDYWKKSGINFEIDYKISGLRTFAPTKNVYDLFKQDADFYYLAANERNLNQKREQSSSENPIFSHPDGIINLLQEEGLPDLSIRLPKIGGTTYKIGVPLVDGTYNLEVAVWLKHEYTRRIY